MNRGLCIDGCYDGRYIETDCPKVFVPYVSNDGDIVFMQYVFVKDKFLLTQKSAEFWALEQKQINLH